MKALGANQKVGDDAIVAYQGNNVMSTGQEFEMSENPLARHQLLALQGEKDMLHRQIDDSLLRDEQEKTKKLQDKMKEMEEQLNRMKAKEQEQERKQVGPAAPEKRAKKKQEMGQVGM